MLETPFPFFVSNESGEIPIFGTFLERKKINFGLYFAENRHFQVGNVSFRHCDVICWLIFMILLSMGRSEPNLYYGTKQLYFERVNFKSTGGGNPPQEDVLKKCHFLLLLAKNLVKFWYLEHFWQSFQFKNLRIGYFEVQTCLWRHCDVRR